MTSTEFVITTVELDAAQFAELLNVLHLIALVIVIPFVFYLLKSAYRAAQRSRRGSE